MVRALRNDVPPFLIGFYFLKKHFLLSFGMCILSTSRKCTSLWIPAVHYVAASRTAPFTSVDGGILSRYSGRSGYFSTKCNLLKDSSVVYENLLGAESSGQSQAHDDKAHSSEILKSIPRGYHDASVLLVGDGDLSFASALSSLKVCRSLVATTWDSKERLIKSFPKAAENIQRIIENGDTVLYGVDATDLPGTMDKEDRSFDTIAWNFPHIPGKQNIKRNRELVQNFMMSAFTLLNAKEEGSGMGMVKIALCDGQSGTKAQDMDDWNFSWKLVHQAAEAGCLLTEIEEFPLDAFDGYKVTGHRGHGGEFPTGTAPQIFTFRRSAHDAAPSITDISKSLPADVSEDEVLAVLETNGDTDSMDLKPLRTTDGGSQNRFESLQAPSYIHEVHLLAVDMVSDLVDLERRAREGVNLIISFFEQELELERISGGAERADALNRVRLDKQLVPVRRRYRTQEDRDEQTAVKFAMVDPIDAQRASISNDDVPESAFKEVQESQLNYSVSSVSPTRHNSSVWAVNLVDVYTCPRTKQISHAFQVTYCSLTRPIGRTVADTYRRRVERDLPIYLKMVPRVVKHGGLVSLSYPWYVTSGVRSILAGSALRSVKETAVGADISSGVEDEARVGEVVDVSDLSAILRELELENRMTSEGVTESSVGTQADVADAGVETDIEIDEDVDASDDRERIRAIARTLWRKRVGVLMQADLNAKSPPLTDDSQ